MAKEACIGYDHGHPAANGESTNKRHLLLGKDFSPGRSGNGKRDLGVPARG